MSDVMLDLETLGNGPNSVIVAIGAVKFDLLRDNLGQEFYCVIDPQSCVDAGMEIDPSTVLWWMGQSEEARKAITTAKKVSLEVALRDFANWIGTDAHVWGNGASFDNVILGNAYRKTGQSQPWKFWNDRCYRTLKNMLPNVAVPQRTGTHHNALDDARFQAEHCIKLLRAFHGKGHQRAE